MEVDRLIELQDGIVTSAAGAIGEEWDCAVVNIEIGDIDGEQRENCLALSFMRCADDWVRSSFEIPDECFDMFVTLRDSSAGEKWSACTLEFDSSGRYRFQYSYAPNRRLNGIHDDEAMLRGFKPLQNL